MGLAGITPSLLAKENDELALPTASNDDSFAAVGFEHLPYQPNQEDVMKNIIIHRADSRGYADHGWLKTHHTFSFSNYYHPERVHFGALRVLNDDTIAGGMGFGTHPHQNMEIVTIPLVGDLAHKDSTNRAEIIRQGDVQIMSAGTGIYHSEFNANKDSLVQLLQIWVLPKLRNIQPRYDQKTFSLTDRINDFQLVVSPNENDEAIWINQDAYFTLGAFDANFAKTYTLRQPATNGMYLFVISGNVSAAGQMLQQRDAMGIWDIKELAIKADTKAEFLIMEIPMQV